MCPLGFFNTNAKRSTLSERTPIRPVTGKVALYKIDRLSPVALSLCFYFQYFVLNIAVCTMGDLH